MSDYYENGLKFYLFLSEDRDKQIITKEMAIIIGSNIKLQIKRTSFKFLTPPYMQRCEQNDKEFVENQNIYEYNGLFNPFTYENEMLFNANEIDNNLYENHRIKKSENCTKNYYEILVNQENKRKIVNKNIVSKFRIFGSLLSDHKWTAFARMNLFGFLTDIGGLFGLWLGLSLFDITQLVNKIVPFLKTTFQLLKRIKILKISFKLKNLIKKFIRELSQIFEHLNLINWKRIFTILFLPILLFQFYDSLNNYLQFSTDLSFEFI